MEREFVLQLDWTEVFVTPSPTSRARWVLPDLGLPPRPFVRGFFFLHDLLGPGLNGIASFSIGNFRNYCARVEIVFGYAQRPRGTIGRSLLQYALRIGLVGSRAPLRDSTLQMRRASR